MTKFFRLSGAGNDFLALAEPEEPPSSEQIRSWCRRGLSLGADGLFHISRNSEGISLRHWNADGGRADLCVNGTRCAARLAFHLGWATQKVGISTKAGLIQATDRGGMGVEIEIEAPEAPREIELECHDRLWKAWYLSVGVSHLVLPWVDPLERAPIEKLGKALRSHPGLGPRGANVNFVSFRPPHELALRTFERGVEAETLACGSGVLAAVAVGIFAQGLELPIRAKTRGGCELRVAAKSRGQEDRAGRHWTLLGDARLLAEGVVHFEATPPC